MRRISNLLDGLMDAWHTARPGRGATGPAVSAVISASVFDVPYLAVTLPHLLRQARFSFGERLVVVDRRAHAWARRRRGSPAELDRIVRDAQAAGLIDRVVELDTSEAAHARLLERYFEPDAARCRTEQPIYSALVGLEAARHDLVAWFDADVLFHASDESWIVAGLRTLARAPDVWMTTTRGGPPPAPRWALALLGSAPRGPTAASRHGLCDRRRLHRRLRTPAATAPARRWINDAVAPARLGVIDSSWHLVPRVHEPPFPQWIEHLVHAVERGSVPPSQRDGRLRLDDPISRSAWRHHLFPDAAVPRRTATGPSRARPEANLVERRTVPGPTPLSVIIPLRNRAGADVRNALASLAWQTSGRPWEVILVSHGSEPAVDAELRRIALASGATLITVGSPADPWCKALALNTGLLASDPAIAFVMTMDGDMILADNMLATVLAELRGDPQQIVLCQSSDLPQGCALPADPEAIRTQFERLQQQASLRGTFGTGGVQAMRRSFLFEVRGYDEDMLWWGALDTDLVRRAEAAGLRASWITERTAMLHQWHPRKYRVLDQEPDKHAAQHAWLRNHEIMLERAKDVRRNPDGWGATLARTMRLPGEEREAPTGSPR